MPRTPKKVIARFVSPALASKPEYKDHIRMGASLTGITYDAVEFICELGELRELLTSTWFVALSRRRRDPDEALKLTIITEVPA